VVTNSYTFNSLFQMTGQTVVRGSTTLQNLTYAYSATQNNGQLQSQTDALSGEIVVYQYDQLNRLTSAETQGSGGWGLNFTYDGFGNKTNQTVTKGSAPTHSLVVNPANNRINMTGCSYL
jgi:YD repeat-containing protein